MNYISLDNLTRYHRNFRNYGDATYALTRGSLWKQTEKAGAVTCWPIGNSRLKPVVEFKFKETLPVSNKSEQNPSTITGISSVRVTRCGKNLLYYPYHQATRTSNGITFIANADGTVTINGTCAGGSFFSVCDSSLSSTATSTKIRLVRGLTYTGSLKKISGSYTGNLFFSTATNNNDTNSFASNISPDGSSYINWNSSGADEYLRYFLAISTGSTFDNLVVAPQLELGTTATSFEPYDGAGYTVNLNGTFYGGILDVSTGTLTVTHRMIEPDSLTIDISNYPAYLPLDCTDTFGRTITSTGNILALTGSTGGKIVYKLANPYTVQIDPVTITALPQIDKYTPRINTLYTDAENITVGYQKSPIRDEYEKVQAIIANGGTI